jgi:DNA-binding transcriptional MerR regulator
MGGVRRTRITARVDHDRGVFMISVAAELAEMHPQTLRMYETRGLIEPKRSPKGTRLYSQADVERLQAILRMQRDEFLPLRVIRQELATGTFDADRRPAADVGQKRRALTVDSQVQTMNAEELADQAGVSAEFLREMSEYGVIQPGRSDGRPRFDETDLEIVKAAAELAQHGVAGRNLRVFRTSADREAALLEQLLGASLRSRSPARRREAVENLENLAAVCGNLKQLLLVRDLRRLKGDEA